jgi:hypothetical protein
VIDWSIREDPLGKRGIGYPITVCGKAESECPFFPGVIIRLHRPFDDPAAFEESEQEKLDKYREIRSEIDLTNRILAEGDIADWPRAVIKLAEGSTAAL